MAQGRAGADAPAPGAGRRLPSSTCPTSTRSGTAHRAMVDTLLPRIDAVTWVVDPEKYDDARVHAYWRELAPHADRLRFVLNKADRLAPEDRATVVEDLRRRLVADGIPRPVIHVVSATTGEGIDELRTRLADAAHAKVIVAAKLEADRAEAADALATAAGIDPDEGLRPLLPDARRDELVQEAIDGALALVDRARARSPGPRGGPPAGADARRVAARSRAGARRHAHRSRAAPRGPGRLPRRVAHPRGDGSRAQPGPRRARRGGVGDAASQPRPDPRGARHADGGGGPRPGHRPRHARGGDAISSSHARSLWSLIGALQLVAGAVLHLRGRVDRHPRRGRRLRHPGRDRGGADPRAGADPTPPAGGRDPRDARSSAGSSGSTPAGSAAGWRRRCRVASSAPWPRQSSGTPSAGCARSRRRGPRSPRRRARGPR